MDIILFFQGMLIGFMAAAPVGAVAIMTIQRTMSQGRFSGFVLGLGSALADLVYAVIAGYSITFISDFLFKHQLTLGIIGSLVLIFIGYRIFIANPIKLIRDQRSSRSNIKLVNDLITAFVITISNPIAIFTFGGLFATLGVLNDQSTFSQISIMIVGVLTGALTWWTTLVLVVNIFRSRIRLRNLFWINRITGIVVFVFGILLLVSLFIFV